MTDHSIRTGVEAMDVDWVHRVLSTDTYWAVGRTRQAVADSLAGSWCYGVFAGDDQIAVARLVTDTVTFGWLSDVYVDRRHRGRGVAAALVRRVTADARAAGLRRVVLATDDAADLYARLGFTSLRDHDYDWMELSFPATTVITPTDPAGAAG